MSVPSQIKLLLLIAYIVTAFAEDCENGLHAISPVNITMDKCNTTAHSFEGEETTFCCPRFVRQDLFPHIIMVAGRQCNKDTDCNNQECKGSIISNGTSTKLSHCYDVIALSGQSAISSNGKLKLCSNYGDCSERAFEVCEEPDRKLKGKKKFCFAGKCPFWTMKEPGQRQKTCKDDADCNGQENCAKAVGTRKYCCIVPLQKMCPLGQVPLLATDMKTPLKICDVDHFQHTPQTGDTVCCALLISKTYVAFGNKDVIPTDRGKSCSNHKDCGSDFCDESVWRSDTSKELKTPVKQCYKNANCNGVVLESTRTCDFCTKEEYCDMNMALVNPGLNGSVCCTLRCPFLKYPLLNPTFCEDSKDCDNGKEGVCQKINTQKSVCCKADDTKLCSGGQYPIKISNNVKCDPRLWKIEQINGEKACCPLFVLEKLRDKGFEMLSTEVECQNEKCLDGQVCEKSALASGLTPKGSPKHCYAMQCPFSLRVPDEELIFCTTHKDCRRKGDLCHFVRNDPLTDVGICCGIDKEFLCPAQQYPYGDGKKLTRCERNELYQVLIKSRHHSIKEEGICCPRLKSKKLQGANIVWPVAGNTDKEIADRTRRICKTSSDCEKGEFCDESVVIMDNLVTRNHPKHCYRVPRCHGKLIGDLTMCSRNEECQKEGELCDKKIYLLEESIKQDALGLCCKFDCPLSINPISKGTSTDKGYCTVKKDCGQLECHSVGLNKLYKGCCEVDKPFRCPGNLLPSMVEGRFEHKPGKQFECHENDFVHQESNVRMCCPRFISYDFYTAGYNGQEGDILEVEESIKTCTHHSDCKAKDEFCGGSILMRDAKAGGNFPSNRLYPTLSHCYKKPLCAGTEVVILPKMGIKTCTKNKDTCTGSNETCDNQLDLTNGKSGKFGKTGVCYKCNGKAPEAKIGSPWVAGKICNCGRDKDYEYCENFTNDDIQVNVCEKTPNGAYRQCTYQREKVQCPAVYDSPLRQNNHLLQPCTADVDCRKDVDLTVRARCVTIGKTILGYSGSKFCCRGDLCGDMFLFRKGEKKCKDSKECQEEGSEGVCEKDSLGKDDSLRCCPKVVEVDKSVRVEIDEPYRSGRKCSSLADCIGENRFCDPYSNVCSYHVRTIQDEHKTTASCNESSIYCDSMQTVCMVKRFDTEPACYRHPLDVCDSNERCHEGEYCAPAKIHAQVKYQDMYRKCYPLPQKSILDSKGLGLLHCKKDTDCGSENVICEMTDKTAMIQPGHGYCKEKVFRQCKGKVNLTYVNGKPKTCRKNTDCGMDEFCDLEVQPTVGIGYGMCCSMPKKCGGEVVKNTVGLKLCTEEKDCSLERGEICSKTFERFSSILWKPNTGVCCRMTCPTSTAKDVVNEVLPAGAICILDNCKSDNEMVRTCVSVPDNQEQRCCAYKRRKDLCPPEKTEGLLLIDYLTVECGKEKKKCPDQSGCFRGFCCRVPTCSVGRFPLNEQSRCQSTSVLKDCGQPTREMANCESGRCCPVKTEPFVTNKKCFTVNDCPDKRVYCHPKLENCTLFGEKKELETKEHCPKPDKDCLLNDGSSGVCVYADDDRHKPPFCWRDPLDEEKRQTQELMEVDTSTEKMGEQNASASSDMMVAIILVVIVVVVILIVMGGVFFYWRFLKGKKVAAEAKQKSITCEEECKSKRTASQLQKTLEDDANNKLLSEEQLTPDRVKKSTEPIVPQFLTL